MKTVLLGACALFFSLAGAQSSDTASDPIASKSIARVYAVQRVVFALAEDGRSFSWLDLFTAPDPEKIRTVTWPWDGGAEDGAAWSQSVLLRANYFISDSQRVARVASARYNAAPSLARSDSLIFRDTNTAMGNGAALTALAVRGDTAVFGFGRLGLAYSALASETGARLFSDSLLAFRAFPSGADTTIALPACTWNHLCRSDTIPLPAGGLDSVIAVAVDSSAPDSAWLLIATQRGLRRGLWKGDSFPYVSLGPNDTARVAVVSVFASPSNSLLWAFTGLHVFFSGDHGATFHAPPPVGPFDPARLTSYLPSLAPQAAFFGDTTFINFNMDSLGLVLFKRDTILPNVGVDLNSVLLNAEDSLDIRHGEGSLTGLAVARNGNAAVAVTGTTLKGIFYRRLDLPGKTFANVNRLRVLKRGLGEVITYPTLFAGPGTPNAPQYVRIGYRLKKDGKVTITVYNYAMEKVRVIVRNAPRRGGIPRSESVGEDRWDGRDASGRLVSVGTYYVHVESDQGESAFGKVVCVRGRQ